MYRIKLHKGEFVKYTRDETEDSTKKVVFAVYLLYALSYLFGFTYLVGVIVAYVKKNDASQNWIRDHFVWQINTFWVTILLSIIGVATMVFGIGWFILMGSAIWNIYRIIKGWLRYNDGLSPY